MATKNALANTLFPIGYAAGPAFCNRDKERAELTENILSGTHTYITGARLYGKTSLVRQVATELSRKRSPKVHSYSIDLLTVHSLEGLDALLREAVGQISAEFLPKNKRVLGALATFFKGFKPELTVREDGFSVKLFSEAVSATTISNLLINLNKAAEHYNRRAVLILDEFQNIAMIDHGETIEESIRLAAKEATALSFVFLGSERAALKLMFENEKRPMHNSQSKHLPIERISASDYRGFLTEASRLRWRKRLGDEVVDKILEVTDRHTHYVNMLCRELWREPRPPTEESVLNSWGDLLTIQRSQAQLAIASLTHPQRGVLAAIANEPTDQPTATEYLGKYRIAGSTMNRGLEVLRERDFIRKTSVGKYEVVDPLVKGVMGSSNKGEAL